MTYHDRYCQARAFGRSVALKTWRGWEVLGKVQVAAIVRTYTRFARLDGLLCTVATGAGHVAVTCGFAEWLCVMVDT